MAKEQRNGQRKKRQIGQRQPDLGYYLIVTDTKETEKNYFEGLRAAIPEHLQRRLVIKVKKADTKDLVDTALSLAAKDAQYREVWIVFDRDEVKGFDEIVARAEKSGICVGWSNPCIEIWFHTYFGKMPDYPDSVTCCSGFGDLFEKRAGKKYNKKDDDIYESLCRHGDEKKAIHYAKQRHQDYLKDGKEKPSDMRPGTTVYQLVEEIKGKTKQ